MTLPKATIKAVIFDMDGLIIDSERVARQAWFQATREWGYDLQEKDYARIVGIKVEDSERVLKEVFGEDFPFKDIRGRRVDLSAEYFRKNGIPVKSGARELIAALVGAGIPRAVATSTRAEVALEKLRKIELLPQFDAVVCGDQVQNGKPAPDIFLAAAKKLNMPPANCAVLEDSMPGIRGAHAAGMYPIMVPDQVMPTPEIREIAYYIAESLHDVQTLLFQKNL